MQYLLLTCCAPCVVAVVERLLSEGITPSLYFYNPNIVPESEYFLRANEVEKVAKTFKVPSIIEPYTPADWLSVCANMEHLPERSTRCANCFKLRLMHAFNYAQAHHFDIVSSVLGVSRWKDFKQVTQIAHCCEQENLPYDDRNWRKNGLQERTRELITSLNIYNQTYCGCGASIR